MGRGGRKYAKHKHENKQTRMTIYILITTPTIKVNRCNKRTYYYQKQNYYSAQKHIQQTQFCNKYTNSRSRARTHTHTHTHTQSLLCTLKQLLVVTIQFGRRKQEEVITKERFTSCKFSFVIFSYSNFGNIACIRPQLNMGNEILQEQ